MSRFYGRFRVRWQAGLDLPQTKIEITMKVPAVTQPAPVQENGWSQIILYSGKAGIWYRGLDLPILLLTGKRVPDRFGNNITVYHEIISRFACAVTVDVGADDESYPDRTGASAMRMQSGRS